MAHDDDDAWRAIVDNYGDRADLDSEEAPAAEADPEPDPASVIDPTLPRVESQARSWDDEYVDSDWTTDGFVPPPPPPLPSTTPDRLAAWLGVFGSPVVLLVCLFFGIALPQPIPFLLVTAFVGGFLYLVITMSREPRDPDDDGAVI